jgi:hypothetical protein
MERIRTACTIGFERMRRRKSRPACGYIFVRSGSHPRRRQAFEQSHSPPLCCAHGSCETFAGSVRPLLLRSRLHSVRSVRIQLLLFAGQLYLEDRSLALAMEEWFARYPGCEWTLKNWIRGVRNSGKSISRSHVGKLSEGCMPEEDEF